MSLIFTAYREEGRSCKYFVNIGVHPVELHVEDVEGGGLDVQEGEVGEDSGCQVQDPGRGRSSFLAMSHPLILSSPGDVQIYCAYSLAIFKGDHP